MQRKNARKKIMSKLLSWVVENEQWENLKYDYVKAKNQSNNVLYDVRYISWIKYARIYLPLPCSSSDSSIHSLYAIAWRKNDIQGRNAILPISLYFGVDDAYMSWDTKNVNLLRQSQIFCKVISQKECRKEGLEVV